MKKKLLSIILSLVCVLGLLACGNNEPVSDKEEPVVEAADVNVTFKDGITKLGMLKVKAGQLIEGYEDFENKEGFEFLGWYETPSMLEASKKDLKNDTFTENTVLYGSWKSLIAEEDTRVFYIVGDGKSPILKGSAWAGADVDDATKESCKLLPTGNTNEFTITLDLFKDDLFQIVYDWQWDGQYGFGKFTDYDANQFVSGGGLSGEASKANVCVMEDGNYTITMVTDVSNPSLDTIKIVRNGEPLGEAAAEAEPFVCGENTTVVMKGSWVADWSENIPLEATGDGFKFTITKEFEKDTELYFMVWDNGEDTGIGMKYSSVDDASKALLAEADNVKIKESGTYTITADAENLTLSITK